jgi:anti-sigma regulatory factor (Ser/Thr protein kinase)
MSVDEAGPNETGALPDGTRVECITVPPQLERVADVRDFIDTLGLETMLSPERLFDLKVATSEAVANVIEHAAKPATVWVRTLSDRVVVDVGNEGGFPSCRSAPPQESPARGLGLRLMVSLADEVAFSGSRRGKNNVKLTFFGQVA